MCRIKTVASYTPVIVCHQEMVYEPVQVLRGLSSILCLDTFCYPVMKFLFTCGIDHGKEYFIYLLMREGNKGFPCGCIV